LAYTKKVVKGKVGTLSLTLTVDLRAKLQRTKSLLETICLDQDPSKVNFTPSKQNEHKRRWKKEVVICTYDKKCYSVIDLLFDHSPASKPVDGLGMSHADYFTKKKKITLKYPNAKPLVAVLGRNQSTIYLPAELVCGNELEPRLKMQLPSIASFKPAERHAAIEEMKRFLKPGAQKTKGVGGGLLPALGIVLGNERVEVPIEVLPLPIIMAAGVRVPERQGGMWAPIISQANFKVDGRKAVELKVVLVYHQQLERNMMRVYERLRDIVNKFNSYYRFGAKPFALVKTGDNDKHWGNVEKYFGGSKLPDNLFVVDFSLPPRRAASDPAYSVVKQMLGKGGHLSQFVNFNTYDHGNPRDEKKSSIILQGVARQVLSKCGVRIWWVNIPRSLPLPAVFVGVDVFHAPRRYDPKENKRTAKESVAAIIVQVIRSHDPKMIPKVEIYSETARRTAGQEMELGDLMHSTVSRALKYLKVQPKSCVVWRDGVGDSTIATVMKQEITQVRRALESAATVGSKAKGAVTKPSSKVAMSYIVCQKRISTKFLSADGTKGMPAGATVTALQGPNYATFYINGTSPPYSTPKPVRFVIAMKDEALKQCSISELTWALCHDYPNWTGPIKLPSPVQMAHKLAELAGGFVDCGESIDAKAYTNKIYFL